MLSPKALIDSHNLFHSMKIFLAFIKKEFRHVWRDRRSLTILLGLPIMMMLLFGFAISNEVKDSKIAVLDYSNDAMSKQLIDRIGQSNYFTVFESVTNEAAIESAFRKGNIRLALIIPPNFGKQMSKEGSSIRIIADASDPNTANIVTNYMNAILADFIKSKFSTQQEPLNIKVESRMLYNPQLKSSYNFVPGVMTLIMMLLGTMMTAVSIVKEKEMGTMEVLLVSPMKPILVIISKAIPYLVLCFIDVLLILLMSYTLLEMPVRGNIPLLLAESLLFILTTLSFGLLISTLVASQQMAMFISLVGFLMPALVFSGFMFPIENMPLPLQIISNVVPTKWYFYILKTIMIKGLGFEYIIMPTIILISMTLIFILLTLRNFKIRLM
jgi:ABC-2 type transport system permease protein